jgi:heptaprenyl diphosphate synthase
MMKLKMMYSFLRTDIEQIERELEVAVNSNSMLLNEASLHLLQAGGKRIRPVFVLLSAMLGKYEIEKVKHVAVALELIHMASLVHDDVVDDASLRRGKPTVKAQWNNQIAMYTGDFIFAKSLDSIDNLSSKEAHQILANTMVELCIGEIDQINDKYRYDQNLRNYFRRIKRKTAFLIAASCQLGGIAGDLPKESYDQLYKFGYNVGMSYQIIDDILDFTSSEKELGKPAGSDLWQGNVTLPVLYAMETEEGSTLIHAIKETSTKDEIKEVINYIKKSDAIERSYEMSQRFLQKALMSLDHFPESRAKKSLTDIAFFIGKRKY